MSSFLYNSNFKITSISQLLQLKDLCLNIRWWFLIDMSYINKNKENNKTKSLKQKKIDKFPKT